jgi:glyoxylase-like metal-dependent hydrolase (beta-lactamase superfamily II)
MHLSLSRFKLAGPPTPRDTEASNAYAIIHDSLGPVCICSLIGINSITQQPIRKVINTHFHWDHWQGNQVYAAQAPHLEIITSEHTKENLTKPDAGVGGLSYIEKQLVAVPKEIGLASDSS